MAHRYCLGRDADSRACRCRCGCRWPDRLTVYRHLAAGDEATDPAWNWRFTATAAPEVQKTGNLAVTALGAEEQTPELVFRGTNEPVIVHNAWRTDRRNPDAHEAATPG